MCYIPAKKKKKKLYTILICDKYKLIYKTCLIKSRKLPGHIKKCVYEGKKSAFQLYEIS